MQKGLSRICLPWPVTFFPDSPGLVDAKALRAEQPYPRLDELVDLVKTQARALLACPKRTLNPVCKDDGSVVTDVDHAMQWTIQKALEGLSPRYGFIGEEMSFEDQVRVRDESDCGYWVLDPLDGTTNYASGFLFYGVSLALIVDGIPVLAVVYDPIRDECFSAARGGGAWLNGSPLSCPPADTLSQCVANVDYKRLTGELSTQLVRCPPYRSQRNLGASVLEWCWLAAGRVQLYLHGGQKLWDFAAGYLILLEAGGAATSLSGSPLDCGKLRKRAVIAAVNDELLGQWKEWVHNNSEMVNGSINSTESGDHNKFLL